MSKDPEDSKLESITWPPAPTLPQPQENTPRRLQHWGSHVLGLTSILFSLPTTWLIVSVLPYHQHVDGSMLSFDVVTNRLLYAINWGLPFIGFVLGFFSRRTWLGKIGMALAACVIASEFLPHYERSE